jgi:hypothetical protein
MNKNVILLLIISLTTLVSNAQIPTTGLIGYWPFNGNGNDESGNGNNGTVNTNTLTSDRFGRSNMAYNFDGNDDYISINGGGIYTIYSITAWFKTKDTLFNPSWKAGIIFSDNHNAFSNIIGKPCIYVDDGGIVKFSGGYSGTSYNEIIYTVPVSDDNWHFAVGTINSTTNIVSFYVDGNFIGSRTAYTKALNLTNSGTSDTRIEIGSKVEKGEYFKGSIDDIRVYNRILTQAEITTLYNETPCLAKIPSAPADDTICIPGKTTLFATGGSSYKWYNAASGGSLLFTGNPYTTNNLTSNTSFYVSNLDSICESQKDTVYIFTISGSVPPTVKGDISVCGSGQAVFTSSYAKSYKWYDALTGGNLLFVGNPFYCPVVTSTTSFYVEIDNGFCITLRATATITVVPLPATPVVATSLLICPNSKTSITASGGTAYKWYDASEGGNLLYTGNPFITNPITVPAKYYVANYNASCESKRSMVGITLKPMPATPKITQNGNVLSSNSTYGNQWGELITGPIGGATNQIYTPTYTGNYYVIVTDNSCLSDTSNLILVMVSSIQNNSGNNHIKIYPNPTSDLIVIELDKSLNYKNGSIELLNTQGKSIYQTRNICSETTINLSKYPRGIYLMKIVTSKEIFYESVFKE